MTALLPTELQEAIEALRRNDFNKTNTAKELGIPRSTLRDRLASAERQGADIWGASFDITQEAKGQQDLEELKERRRKEWQRKRSSTPEILNVSVRLDGPIGLLFMGDPHVDDPGTNFPLLERHVEIINRTPALFAANLGDISNNWIGRLASLYEHQATTSAEAWQLTEWLVTAVDWLYIVGGNHDLWSGSGDPIKWMVQNSNTVYRAHQVRIAMNFPNGKEVRVNTRHDFPGHSMWNTVHGLVKAATMGHRDHILAAGHKHTSGYGMVKDPLTGLISHVVRCAGYKELDEYAAKLGLSDVNMFPSSVAIIDPEYDDSDPRLVTMFFEPEAAADYLTWLRKKSKSANTPSKSRT